MKQVRFLSGFALLLAAILTPGAFCTAAYGQTGSSRQSVVVRIKYFTSTKEREYPLADEPVQLRFEGKTLDGKTNRLGILQFRRVPCDQEVTVWFRGTPQAVFKRWFVCGKTANWVYFFDSYALPEGKIIQQR